MTPDEVAAAPTVVRWIQGGRFENDPEDEQQGRLRLLADFCAHAGKTPDELVAGLLRTTKGGDAAISGKRRKETNAAIDEFVDKSGLTGKDAVVTGNQLRSFLVHNGIFIQGRIWRG